MFLIAIDSSGQLLVEHAQAHSGRHIDRYSLPNLVGEVDSFLVANWLGENGYSLIDQPKFFDVTVCLGEQPDHYAVCSIGYEASTRSDLGLTSLDLLWKKKVDGSISVVMNQIMTKIESVNKGLVVELEKQFLFDFNLKKVSPRVFFAQTETVEANEMTISILGALAKQSGDKTARLCMHQNQNQAIQEMLMIHSEQISTGPLRQNNNSSVSYRLIRGALEITLHHGGTTGETDHRVEFQPNSQSTKSSLRVPARVFRTIKTLTDSAVFVEVQSGPFIDSDTEWSNVE